MPAISFYDAPLVVQAISWWAASRDLARIYSQEGGWEGYAQVELAIYLLGTLGGSITREQNVYAGAERADILAENSLDPSRSLFIELKCQSWLQDSETLNNFADRVHSDMMKCDPVLTKRAEKYRYWPGYAVGIGVDFGGVERAIEIFSGPKFDYGDKTFWIQARDDVSNPVVFYAVFP